MTLPRSIICLCASIVLAAILAPDARAQGVAPRPERFDLDADHSEIGFSVGFMGLSTVRGAFADYRGTIMVTEDDPARSSVSVVIRAASINTNSVQRDRHLRSPDFFDVEKYPVIVFRSTSITRSADGFVATGPLTMHGITRDIRIPFTLLHTRRTDAWGNTRLGARGRVIIDRKDYGIQGTAFWNSEFDPGRMAVSDEVTVELLVEAVIQNLEAVQAPRADSVLRAVGERGIDQVTREYRAAAGTDSTLRRASEMMLVNAARKALQRKQTAAAIELFALASELHPASAMAAAQHGDALRVGGRVPEARVAFRKALAIDPLNPLALEGMRVTESG